MPTDEKELNAILFDQLSLVERIERALKSGGVAAAEAEIDIVRKEIERKLYQSPPLAGGGKS